MAEKSESQKEEWSKPAEKYTENLRGSLEAFKRMIDLEVSLHGQVPVALCLLDALASFGLKLDRSAVMENLRSSLKNKALLAFPQTSHPDTPGILDNLFRRFKSDSNQVQA